MSRRYCSGTKWAWMSIVRIECRRERRTRIAARTRALDVWVRRLIEASCLVDDGNFFYGKLRRDFRTFLRDHHHLFEPHAPLKRLAVLRFQSEAHPRLDHHGKVERVNA